MSNVEIFFIKRFDSKWKHWRFSNCSFRRVAFGTVSHREDGLLSKIPLTMLRIIQITVHKTVRTDIDESIRQET